MSKRTLVKEILAERPKRSPYTGRCIYGGERCYGLTCEAHRPLLTSDPNFTLADPYQRQLKEARAA